METITKIINQVDALVWGVPMLVLLIGTGIFMTICLKGLQFRKFVFIMKNTVGKLF